MKLHHEKVGGVTVATFTDSDLDARNARAVKEELSELLADSPRLVLDMSELEFVDSSGLGAILSALRLAGALGGDLKLCCMARPVRALFELVRMHRIIDILNTRAEALAAFAGEEPAWASGGADR
jgi:anti-sigma B factor antagonist